MVQIKVRQPCLYLGQFHNLPLSSRANVKQAKRVGITIEADVNDRVLPPVHWWHFAAHELVAAFGATSVELSCGRETPGGVIGEGQRPEGEAALGGHNSNEKPQLTAK